ncbi:ABC transporter permease [Treponema phagedenis]|uniref:ABC transporter permease n=1 Tax=Treponema phagedenis TaxID=162 RepID=UPI0001F63DC9|nr:FtsX-like permease family protein [Treponema phagedenis]EFW38386.1 efflux ABC transporter, permease protein [Treponema phagedenis F0421]QSH98698.1 ABC transporter permease [Treponema phagedenis]TYT78506.1 ABC transporter permease [Treponema phagedenis]
MIIKIAIKNLFANKAKTIILMSLIGLGSFFIILGLGLLNFGLGHLKEICISDFSGDILIVGNDNPKIQANLTGATVKSGISTSMPKTPYLPEPKKIISFLEETGEVQQLTTTTVSSFIMVEPKISKTEKDTADSSNRIFIIVLGITPEPYKKMFDTIKITDGKYPDAQDKQFFLMPNKIKTEIEKKQKISLKVGDLVTATSFLANAKTKTIDLTISGFFDYAHPDAPITEIAYTDVDSSRQLSGMIMGAKVANQIPESMDISLAQKSEDELFSAGNDMFTTVNTEKKLTQSDVENILGDTSLRDSLNLSDTEAWNHIAVKLKHPAKTTDMIQKLNKHFDAENIPAIAIPWDIAMANYTAGIQTTQVLFTSVLILLSVIVLIVIMNTLVVSIMERTGEIGTMRALGAKRSYIRTLFYTESAFMALVASAVGAAFAIITGIILNSLAIRFGDILALFFGSYKVGVIISVSSVLSTVFAILLASLIAGMYPIRVALKISPLEAMNK